MRTFKEHCPEVRVVFIWDQLNELEGPSKDMMISWRNQTRGGPDATVKSFIGCCSANNDIGIRPPHGVKYIARVREGFTEKSLLHYLACSITKLRSQLKYDTKEILRETHETILRACGLQPLDVRVVWDQLAHYLSLQSNAKLKDVIALSIDAAYYQRAKAYRTSHDKFLETKNFDQKNLGYEKILEIVATLGVTRSSSAIDVRYVDHQLMTYSREKGKARVFANSHFAHKYLVNRHQTAMAQMSVTEDLQDYRIPS